MGILKLNMKFTAITAALLGAALAANDQIFYDLSKEEFMYAPDANGCYSDTDLIKMSEGYRACTYLDTMGIKTVCYGYNLESGSASEVSKAGGDYQKLLTVGACTTQTVCNNLLNMEVQKAESAASSIFGGISCQCAKAVTVDMTYNLGSSGMRSFSTFDSLVKQGKYADAAADGRSTLWCSQVGNRCERDMSQLEKC